MFVCVLKQIASTQSWLESAGTCEWAGVRVNDTPFIPFPSHKNDSSTSLSANDLQSLSFHPVAHLWYLNPQNANEPELSDSVTMETNPRNYVTEGSPTVGREKVNFNGRLWPSGSLFTSVQLHVHRYV